MRRLMVLGVVLGMAVSLGGLTALAQSGSTRTLVGMVHYNADMVPEELLGYWHRTRYIVDSSQPEAFCKKEEGSWTLTRLDDRIFLMNPDTGAQAEVSIQSVTNRTAVFEYKEQLSNGNWCVERLVLTSIGDGDQMQGTQSKQCFPGGQQSTQPYFYAVARVEGERADLLPPLTF